MGPGAPDAKVTGFHSRHTTVGGSFAHSEPDRRAGLDPLDSMPSQHRAGSTQPPLHSVLFMFYPLNWGGPTETEQHLCPRDDLRQTPVWVSVHLCPSRKSPSVR